jgi:hypothetical protein
MFMVLAVLGVSSPAGFGGIIWNEAVNGQLSTNPASPTVLTVFPGSNEVIGETHGPIIPATQLATDADIFSFTVGQGFQLTAINILAFNYVPNTNPANPISYAAVQTGGRITSTTSGAALLGATLFGNQAPYPGVGGDLLPALAGGPTLLAGSGFTPPLGAGQYTFWVQETNGSTSYDFAFQITPDPIPEPSTLTLFTLGGLALAGWRWRRQRAVKSGGPRA